MQRDEAGRAGKRRGREEGSREEVIETSTGKKESNCCSSGAYNSNYCI
jgi:hypothetical protein